MQLDNRAQTLLKALVERYIADGQPVGSRALSKISGLELSPATIRNIMADLEEMGFVASPHTSAGRVPTPRGYRMFVDTLLTVEPIDESALESKMQARLQPNSQQKIIANAAQVLSSLSHFAGVVLSPRRESIFQQIEFLRLSEKRILLVIVSPNGDVQNRLLLTDVDYSPAKLVQAANYINQHYGGLSLDDVYPSRAKKAAGRKGGKGSVAPKYRDPSDAAQTWSGRGRQPLWFSQALKRRGVTAESLLIGGATPSSTPVKKTRAAKKAPKKVSKRASRKTTARKTAK